MFFFFQAEDGIRDWSVTGVQTCALPISSLIGLAVALTRMSATARPIRDARIKERAISWSVPIEATSSSRSEERRVGKEWRARGAARHEIDKGRTTRQESGTEMQHRHDNK